MNTTQDMQLWHYNLQQYNKPIFVADRIISNQEILITRISELETQLEQSNQLLAETNANLEHALTENEHLQSIVDNTKQNTIKDILTGVFITVISELIILACVYGVTNLFPSQ